MVVLPSTEQERLVLKGLFLHYEPQLQEPVAKGISPQFTRVDLSIQPLVYHFGGPPIGRSLK